MVIELTTKAVLGNSPLRKALDAFISEQLLLGYSALKGNRLAEAMLAGRGMTPDDVFRQWGRQVGIDGTDNDA